MMTERDFLAIRSLELAQEAAIERLLNSYLREMRGGQRSASTGDLSLVEMTHDGSTKPPDRRFLMSMSLPASRAVLIGEITYLSTIGYHQFGNLFWVGQDKGQLSFSEIPRMKLVDLILTEISSHEPDEEIRESRRQSLQRQIENSIEKTALYVEHSLYSHSGLDVEGEGRLLDAEQSLLFGHPFHPMPKSSEGFSPDDLDRYAPELGASFSLHYFALSHRLVYDDFLPEPARNVIPASVLSQAGGCLNLVDGDWRLLPCHPRQATSLYRLPQVQTLIAEGELRYLGPLGEPVYPTSSVRTVFDPDHPFFFKLPLNVRITNFIRINPLEHLQRSMDVSRAIKTLRSEVSTPGFSVLLEVGFRTIACEKWGETEREELASQFGVLFRESPAAMSTMTPMVLASLLESSPQSREPAIVRALWRAGGGRPPDFSLCLEWLGQYLKISVLPLLRLFIQTGISLEAHVQNTLVALNKGWPVHLFVRDLEGGSISRERAEQNGLYNPLLHESSPAFYSDKEAWHRLKYYLFVNQLGHLISTIARYLPAEEAKLWQAVRSVLEERSGVAPTHAEKRYLEELLDDPKLPAKANLLSCFQQRGEQPVYVAIPNPLRPSEIS
jgi:L-2,3-diaminopropanoate---citrate ligase